MRTHNARKYTDVLRSCLVQDKKPVALFVGAGCPLAVRIEGQPLIPDIAGLTATIATEIAKSEHAQTWETVLAQCNQAIKKPTIEDILTHVRALVQVAEAGVLNGLKRESLGGLDRAICSQIASTVSKSLPASGTPYHQLARWIASIPRTEPIQLFTTNYDLLLEQALEEEHVPYFDGFVGGRRAFFDINAIEEDVLPARWARLWKLHGSINWQADKNDVVRIAAGAYPEQYLIHPSHLKYDQSRRMPYLAMLDRLRHFLRVKGAVLITLGYSFGDQHLNEALIQGLSANRTAAVFGLLYPALESLRSNVEFSRRLPNCSIFARDSAIIGGQQCSWNNDDGNSAEFPMGDFLEFGKMLQAITGDSSIGAT